MDPESLFLKEWASQQMPHSPMQELRVICVRISLYARQNCSGRVGLEKVELGWRWELELERVKHVRSDLLTRVQHQQWQAIQARLQRDGVNLEQ